MGKDLLIIPTANGTVTFKVRGDTADTGWALLQRLYVLLLSGQLNVYRGNGGPGYSLLEFLKGGNYPSIAAMNSVLGLCSAGALGQLDAEDRGRIASFQCTANTDRSISAVLTLKDGTTLEGIL